MQLRHGPGTYADPDAKPQRWGGRRAIEYVARTLAEYGDICIICGRPGSNSADHIIPRAEGGAVYDLANLGPAHDRCNYSRGKKPLRPVGIPIENGMRFFSP
ncbi:HNH endonuclease [Microbacterium allomyrinae]|uniref:HNH endonuclease n=1 Tax=Microbacterium allomyrinae TaxID=2830666 RepID=A0A9X1LYQ1_9MICO|nr:HNH endonuclease signature motif containing protein [Microbacterium allomyrinae]MCC2034216.1 HNH endonuclease [Microbacterium allomyrinae]